MNPPAPRWSFKKKLAIALLIAGGLALSLGIAVMGVAWSRWRAMDREVARLISESAARNGPRPTLGGEAVPGNAWDEYLLALEELSTRPVKTPGNLRAFAGRAGGADREQIEMELAAHRTALEHLARGARRAESRPPFTWDGESLLPYAGEGLLRKLAELSVCRVRILREKGDPQAALGALLETGQFARDAACNTTSEYEWEGLGALELVLYELQDLALSRRLKDADLDDLERGLRTLDETLARDGGPLLNDVALFGRFLQREDPYLEADGTYIKRRPLSPGWRHAFSMALFKTDAFNRWLQASTVHAAAGRAGWDEARKVYSRNAALLESLPENQAVLRLTAPSLETNRLREARLGLLRMAVQFLRSGKVEARLDPFGSLEDGEKTLPDGRRERFRAPAELRFSLGGGSLRAWSRGPNGVDDEGISPDRPRNTTGSTTIIGPALDAADDLSIIAER